MSRPSHRCVISLISTVNKRDNFIIYALIFNAESEFVILNLGELY